jgi:WD40 repeat protein
MVTGSRDKTLRLWDLETGVVLKKMEGHNHDVNAVAVSRDGSMIASGDDGGELIVWHGETGETLTKPIKAQSYRWINSVDFSPDGTVLAIGSGFTVNLWCTKTWQIMQGDPINDRGFCIRYSPSGELLAIATYEHIQIYNPGTRERVASFKGHRSESVNKSFDSFNLSLAWTPDGTRLLSGGSKMDPTIREWNSLTWQQVGLPWEGHTSSINAIAIHPAGTLVASVSDNDVRLWQFSDRRTIAIFHNSLLLYSVTFSVDGRHILSGSQDGKISEWEVLKYANSKASFHSSIV